MWIETAHHLRKDHSDEATQAHPWRSDGQRPQQREDRHRLEDLDSNAPARLAVPRPPRRRPGPGRSAPTPCLTPSCGSRRPGRDDQATDEMFEAEALHEERCRETAAEALAAAEEEFEAVMKPRLSHEHERRWSVCRRVVPRRDLRTLRGNRSRWRAAVRSRDHPAAAHRLMPGRAGRKAAVA